MAFIIKALGFANGVACPIAGQYLKSFDFEAHDGRGFGVFTANPAEAMTFESAGAAGDFWRTQSKTVPLRPDGKPNRPLTSTTVEIALAPAS